MIEHDKLKQAFELRLNDKDYEEISAILCVDKTELEKTMYYVVRGKRTVKRLFIDYEKYRYPNLLKWMHENNKTQKDLGEALGLTATTVNYWLVGTNDIRTIHLIKLKEITGLTYDELLSDKITI